MPGQRAVADGLLSCRAKRCDRGMKRAAIALSEARADRCVLEAIPADGEGSAECSVLGGEVGTVVGAAAFPACTHGGNKAAGGHELKAQAEIVCALRINLIQRKRPLQAKWGIAMRIVELPVPFLAAVKFAFQLAEHCFGSRKPFFGPDDHAVFGQGLLQDGAQLADFARIRLAALMSRQAAQRGERGV